MRENFEQDISSMYCSLLKPDFNKDENVDSEMLSLISKDLILDIGYAEALAVASKYDYKTLKYLWEKSRVLNQKKKLFDFIIVIPYVHRPVSLKRLLISIDNEISRFGYGTLNNIKVLVFEDGETNESAILNEYTPKFFQLDFFSTEVLRKFIISLYPVRNNEIHAWTELFGDMGATYRGPMVMANIAKAFLSREYSRTLSSKVLISHMDSDQDFGIQTFLDNQMVGNRDNVFDYFGNIARIFSTFNFVKILSCKLVGDPPVTPFVMTHTMLQDLKGLLIEKSETALHLNNYDNDLYPYYDLGFLKTLKEYQIPEYYPILNIENSHKSLFDKLPEFFQGHHFTRPVLYHPKSQFMSKITGISRKIQKTDIINPGNVIYRKESLEYPYLFAKYRIRMGGPILGKYISQLGRHELFRAFLPMRHQRAEFRLGVQPDHNNKFDFTPEATRQIQGDFCLKLLDLNPLDQDVNSYNLNKAIALAYDYTLTQYQDHKNSVLLMAQEILDTMSLNRNDDNSNKKIVEFVNNIISIFSRIDATEVLSKEFINDISTSFNNVRRTVDYWNSNIIK